MILFCTHSGRSRDEVTVWEPFDFVGEEFGQLLQLTSVL